MVNLYDLARLDDDGNMKAKTVYLPEGRHPLLLSPDDVYYVQDGDGIATKLVVGEDGKVRNESSQKIGRDDGKPWRHAASRSDR